MRDVTVQTSGGQQEVIRVNAVINAHGPVNRWSWPDIPGLQDFAGPVMHTAAWDPKVDVKGKRVAVIGTGASAAQLVPAIALQVGELTIFMRSRHWVINNPEILNKVEPGVKWALANIPHFKEWFRFRIYWNGSDGLFVNVLKDPEWQDEHSVSRHNGALRRYSLHHMEQKLGDRPDLLESLIPDYPIFAKRIIMDGGWFDALRRGNVTVEQGSIDCVLPHAIRMQDGTEHAVDCPLRQPKRGRLWLNDGSCIRLRPEYPGHVWVYDFVEGRTHDGHKFRILTIIDEASRECLALIVARQFKHEDVLAALTDLFISRGPPAHIRSDNGSEFIATAVRIWRR